MRRIALGVEVAGVLVQLALLQQVLDYRRSMGCGEQCAYAAMGLMVMLLAGAYVFIPGVVAALYLGREAYSRWRQDGPLLTVLLHAAPLVLLGVLVTAAALPAPKRNPVPVPKTAAPLSNADQEMAGYVWASDTVIVAEQDCRQGSASFIVGCRRYVREHPAAPR